MLVMGLERKETASKYLQQSLQKKKKKRHVSSMHFISNALFIKNKSLQKVLQSKTLKNLLSRRQRQAI